MKKTKVCNGPTCDKTEWSLSEFNKDRSRKDGLAPYCKRCQSHYHKERYKNPKGKQVKLSYNKKYYKTEAGKESKRKAYINFKRPVIFNAILKAAIKPPKNTTTIAMTLKTG
jgi:hypothetical protein